MIWSMFAFGILTLVSAAGVVFSRRALHSALYLVLTLLLLAVNFALLDAQFLAALQVLIYAGAIVVLVVFVVMLLGIDESRERHSFRLPAVSASVFVGAFGGLAVFVIHRGKLFDFAQAASGKLDVAAKTLGIEIFAAWFYPVQLIGAVLLAAILAAVMLASEPKRPLPPGRGLRAKRETDVEKSVEDGL